MDGVYAAPTGPQIALFGELERDYRQKIAEAEALKKLGVPAIL